MGYIRHDAIIITAFDNKHLIPAHGHAKALGLPVSDIIESPVNGYHTFLVAPDGSKEGWSESKKGDESRSMLISWIHSHPDLYLDWVHVNYGGDDKDQCRIVDYADDGERLEKLDKAHSPLLNIEVPLVPRYWGIWVSPPEGKPDWVRDGSGDFLYYPTPAIAAARITDLGWDHCSVKEFTVADVFSEN